MDELTDIEQVRLNLGEDIEDETTHVLSDAALATWLTAFNGSVDRATWRALITIATSEALISKKLTSQHLSTDGPALSAELRALAQTYKDMADADDNANYFAGYVLPPGAGRLFEAEEYRWPQ